MKSTCAFSFWRFFRFLSLKINCYRSFYRRIITIWFLMPTNELGKLIKQFKTIYVTCSSVPFEVDNVCHSFIYFLWAFSSIEFHRPLSYRENTMEATFFCSWVFVAVDRNAYCYVIAWTGIKGSLDQIVKTLQIRSTCSYSFLNYNTTDKMKRTTCTTYTSWKWPIFYVNM